jgi:hypothetical protein
MLERGVGSGLSPDPWFATIYVYNTFGHYIICPNVGRFIYYIALYYYNTLQYICMYYVLARGFEPATHNTFTRGYICGFCFI